ncbi:MAG: response regulator [Deltaproteobacteria bacterium]|nr:response regulator [Deltaproteobacteria bacterium]
MDNGGLMIWDFMAQFENAVNIAPTRVLVLEDDLCLKTVVTGLFRSIEPNIIIDSSASSDPVLAALKADPRALHQYDLIFADIYLQGASTGLDLWHSCRLHCPNVHFLLTSTLSMEQLKPAVGEEGLRHTHFLPKPFPLEVCRATLEKLLRY